MRFPDLLVEFYRLQNRVGMLIFDIEDLRKRLHQITPGDEQGLKNLVSRETEQLTIDSELEK